MNPTGLSLFMEGESIKLNTSLNRSEEEEALEDQRRRNEEIGNQLQNAFDDLEDDDNTIDSRKSIQSNLNNNIIDNNNHQGHINGQLHGKMLMVSESKLNSNIFEEVHLLRMRLDSQTSELEKLRTIAIKERRKNEDLQKKFAIAETEMCHAISSKKNDHELLVESKEKCSNLEDTITKLKSDIKSLKIENNTLFGELETSKTILADVQQKYHMVEKNGIMNNDRNVELKKKRLDEAHRAEIEIMEQRVEALTNKLNKKTVELENINTRYKALQDSHEQLLIEKSSKIRELDSALIDAQEQVQILLRKHDFSQDNIVLQKQVSGMKQKINEMEGTIDELTSRLELTTTELDAMDDVLFQNKSEDSPQRFSQPQGRIFGSTLISPVDKLNHLKSELYRAMANLKNKRETIRTIQQTIELQNAEIKTLREEENTLLVQISTLKEEKLHLENRQKILEDEVDELSEKLKKGMDNKYIHMDDLVNRLQDDKNLLEQTKLSLEKQNTYLETKLKIFNNLEKDFEALKQEHKTLKCSYEEVVKKNVILEESKITDHIEWEKNKLLLRDSQKECDRLKTLYVEISNKKEALVSELERLQNSDQFKELRNEKSREARLQHDLQLSEIKLIESSNQLEAKKLLNEKCITKLTEKNKEVILDSLNKVNLSDNCPKCIEHVAEITKLEFQTQEFSNSCSKYKKEIYDLSAQLIEAKFQLSEMSERIGLSKQQEEVIVKLKARAEQFEEYIKSQSSSLMTSSPKEKKSLDKSVETSPDLYFKFVQKKVEAQIRDEMAKIFANELKNYELKFQIKLSQMEDQTLLMRNDLHNKKLELIQRQNEVQLLKHAILSEREKVNELLESRDSETQKIFQKQNVVLHKCRDELKLKNQRISELLTELKERQMQIEAERNSMKAVMSQWEEQRKSVDILEKEWRVRIYELKKNHEILINSLQNKYSSAKRTAANYKRYAEDKEKHMLQEYDRIKSEYESSLSKIDARIKESFEKKNREMRDAIAEVEKKA